MPGTIRQTFFASGRCLGSRQVPWIARDLDNRPYRPRSIAYCCPECGEVWGRVLYEGSPRWQFWPRACLRHGDGSLASPPHWRDCPEAFAENWPDEAVKYEFTAALNKLGATE